MSDVGIDTPEVPSVVVPAPSGDTPISPREAARALGKWRHDPSRSPREPKEQPVAVADAPAAEESTAQVEDAAPPEQETTGETQVADPVTEPAIEPPRSWTKEARANWAKLDPDTQRFLLDQDSQTSATVKQRLNEAAEKLKGLTAKEQQVEQARTQYEQALPILLQTLQAQTQGDFADIKTLQDVERLSREDWPRYLQWDFQQKKVAAVVQQLQSVQAQRSEEDKRRFSDFAKKEGALFLEKVPDMADPAKASELQKDAMATLTSAGFEENELARAWQGHINVPFRDHRVQLMIHKAALWDKAQAKAKTVVQNAKPLPPVQRPGAAQPKGAAQAAQIETLGKKIDGARNYTEGAKLGAQLLRARRAAR